MIEPARADDLPALAELLVACVRSGSSVGFLDGLTHEQAAAWWREHLAVPAHHVLVARDGDAAGTAIGTVTLVLAGMPNGRHRAEVAKLLVHPQARRRGVARRLLGALEAEALVRGRNVLVLDTESGSAAEQVYPALGYEVVGVIPEYAARTDGRLAATTVMTKRLVRPPAARQARSTHYSP